MPKRRKTIGKLPPRYSFILNPHLGTRLSKCPKCDGLTFVRKFVLFIHRYERGDVALRFSCRWCAKCQLVMAHQRELEAELAGVGVVPGAGDEQYFVIGTAELKFWKSVMAGAVVEARDYLDHVADFKEQLDLGFDPGGWRKAE